MQWLPCIYDPTLPYTPLSHLAISDSDTYIIIRSFNLIIFKNKDFYNLDNDRDSILHMIIVLRTLINQSQYWLAIPKY